MYEPKPLDTSRVELEPELCDVAERLAAHEHDLWARGLIDEGWTAGPSFDEVARTHPGLVSFGELPEPERAAKRRVAAEALRGLLALGFAISRPNSATEVDGPEVETPRSDEDLPGVRARADGLLGMGEPLLAYEAVEASLGRWPGDVRLRQLRGIAMARSGATGRANRAMLELLAEGRRDGSTLGILGRTHKDLAAQATTARERNAQLRAAMQAYQEGYHAARRTGNAQDAYFTGINAATLSLLTDQVERATGLAGEVRATCLEELKREPRDPSYWLVATLAEAALLLGDRAEAEERYRRAADVAGPRFADLATTRRQARLILAHRNEDASWIDALLRVPPVAVFSGHMLDPPERPTPRFPANHEEAVARRLRDLLDRTDVACGYASAARGSDILFLEAMLDRQRDVHVVLPFPADRFIETSVEGSAGSWRERFDRILARAASVTVSSDYLASGSTSAYVYANLILSGMATLHAQRLQAGIVGVAVWDGQSSGAEGGTGSAVLHWQSRGLACEWIDPADPEAATRSAPACDPQDPRTDQPPGSDETSQPLMAMLFADALGYSRLSDDQIPLFVQHLMAPVADLIAKSSEPPVLKETAGDGLYFVFPSVAAAGVFALELRDLVANVDWESHGLPGDMSLRIALHCGPVHRLVDPITGRDTYTGPHTSRAARIEPITPPGQVYASHAFAALAAASGVGQLRFEYVGRTALAKQAGLLGLYHVRRGEETRSPD